MAAPRAAGGRSTCGSSWEARRDLGAGLLVAFEERMLSPCCQWRLENGHSGQLRAHRLEILVLGEDEIAEMFIVVPQPLEDIAVDHAGDDDDVRRVARVQAQSLVDVGGAEALVRMQRGIGAADLAQEPAVLIRPAAVDRRERLPARE